MEISTVRNRVLVGVFATVMIVGSGVATALVTARDEPPLGEAVETASTGDTVDSTPSTPGVTTGTTPGGEDESSGEDASDDVERFWDPEVCGDDDPSNHGQYVSNQPKGGDARSTAAQSDCGKPLASIGEGGDAPQDDDADDGPPETPGSGTDGARNGNGNAYGRNK